MKEARNMSNKSTFKNNLSNIEGSAVLSSLTASKINDDAYYEKERKNIHSMFTLFNELPLEESKKIA